MSCKQAEMTIIKAYFNVAVYIQMYWSDCKSLTGHGLARNG